MQQCSKCGRTYQDDAQKFCTFDGGRLAPMTGDAPTVTDLNRTIQTNVPQPPAPGTTAPISPPSADLLKTMAGPAPTSEFYTQPTGPTSMPTSQPLPSAPISAPLESQQQAHAHPAPPAAAPAPQQAKGKSRLPLILGGVALLLLLLLAGGGVLAYFLIWKSSPPQRITNINVDTGSRSNTNTGASDNSNATANANAAPSPTATAQTPPPNSTQFVNTRSNLNQTLQDHYADFSFYYPRSWDVDQKAGTEGSSNFTKVERRLPPDFTQENFAVGWYESTGTVESDRPVFPSYVKSLSSKFAESFPEYKKLSEGETTVNGMGGYEFRFQSVSRGTEKGDINIWGRVIFLPPGTEGQKNGITLLMLATSVAPELRSADDVGVKGELPMILNSFRLGQSK